MCSECIPHAPIAFCICPWCGSDTAVPTFTNDLDGYTITILTCYVCHQEIPDEPVPEGTV